MDLGAAAPHFLYLVTKYSIQYSCYLPLLVPKRGGGRKKQERCGVAALIFYIKSQTILFKLQNILFFLNIVCTYWCRNGWARGWLPLIFLLGTKEAKVPSRCKFCKLKLFMQNLVLILLSFKNTQPRICSALNIH